MMRSKDWAEMASYVLPILTVTGVYVDCDGTVWGTVAVAMITAGIVAALHVLNSFRDPNF